MFSTLVTAPATPLFTTAEAKAQLRVTSSAEDDLIDEYVAAATAYFDARDGVTGQALITQTWKLTLASDEWENGLRLPIEPVQSISGFEYYIDGVLTTFAAENYRLTDGRVYLVDGDSLPSTDTREDAVQITYLAGYGDTSADVPQTAREAVALFFSGLYDQRTAEHEGTSQMTIAFQSLLAASRSARGLF